MEPESFPRNPSLDEHLPWGRFTNTGGPKYFTRNDEHDSPRAAQTGGSPTHGISDDCSTLWKPDRIGLLWAHESSPKELPVKASEEANMAVAVNFRPGKSFSA